MLLTTRATTCKFRPFMSYFSILFFENFCLLLLIFVCLGVEYLGIGGPEDMKRICGITVAEEKDKVGRADKVIFIILLVISSRVLRFFVALFDSNVRLRCTMYDTI